MNRYILWRLAKVIADSRQDCPSERRRRTTVFDGRLNAGRPDGRPCVASFSR